METENKTKKCRQCQTDIPVGAKKCPNCQSDLRNWFRRHPVLTILGVFIIFVITISAIGGGGDKKEITPGQQQETQKYPSFTEETMNKNCVLSCAGGDEVVLWDKPTAAAKGARLHNKVPCGTRCWAFNKYYNEELNVTFYAVNTLDPRVENAWGWITEDLITWFEE